MLPCYRMKCKHMKPVHGIADYWESIVVHFTFKKNPNQPIKKNPLREVMMCKFYLFSTSKRVLLKTADAQTLYMFNPCLIMSNLEIFLHFYIKNDKSFTSLSAKQTFQSWSSSRKRVRGRKRASFLLALNALFMISMSSQTIDWLFIYFY